MLDPDPYLHLIPADLLPCTTTSGQKLEVVIFCVENDSLLYLISIIFISNFVSTFSMSVYYHIGSKKDVHALKKNNWLQPLPGLPHLKHRK
jgi:predicted membrane channel-forming protein YqfA (hemolysin III family)